jgi:hypothetical protein
LLTLKSYVEAFRIAIHRHNVLITTLSHKSLWEYKPSWNISPVCWERRSLYLLEWTKRAIIFHYRFIQAVNKGLRKVFYMGHTIPQLLNGSDSAVAFPNNKSLDILDAYVAYVVTDQPWAEYDSDKLGATKNITHVGENR